MQNSRTAPPSYPLTDVLLPEYDRARSHEPELGRARVRAAVRLVLVEGLFVARAGGAWDAVRGLLSEVVALDLPLALCRARCLYRRLSTTARAARTSPSWGARACAPPRGKGD